MHLHVRIARQVAKQWNALPGVSATAHCVRGNEPKLQSGDVQCSFRSRHQAGQATHLHPAWLSCGWCGAAAGRKPGGLQ